MAAKIAEDCACGASFKYEGPIPSSVLSEWRRAHASHAQRVMARKEKFAATLQEDIDRIKEILKEAENACDKYEKDSGITCGWKRTVLAIREVIKDG